MTTLRKRIIKGPKSDQVYKNPPKGQRHRHVEPYEVQTYNKMQAGLMKYVGQT